MSQLNLYANSINKSTNENKLSISKINLRKLFVSPYGATIFPLFLLVVAFLFPPSIYTHFVKEPDYMFLNINMLSFGLLCTLFYYMGIFIFSYKPFINVNLSVIKITVSRFTYIILISLLTIILPLVSILLFFVYFFKVSGISMLQILILGSGQLIKNYLPEIHIPLGLGAIPTFIMGFEFWLLYQIYSLNKTTVIYSKKKLKFLKFTVFLSASLFILESIITVGRTGLIIFIIGWLMIYSYFNRVKIFSKLVKIFFVILILFFLTSLLRWSSDNVNIVGKLLGYTIADFNRMALMIDGRLSYVSAGIPRIFYLLPIFKIPLTNIGFIKIQDYAFLSLMAVGNAGLNASYNMATLFGGMFQAIGMWTPIYFLLLGFIGSRLFQSFKRGKIFGIVLYPLFYSSVALWMVDVNFFVVNFFYYFYAFIILVLYSAFLKVKEQI
jgi:hypothetical protein